MTDYITLNDCDVSQCSVDVTPMEMLDALYGKYDVDRILDMIQELGPMDIRDVQTWLENQWTMLRDDDTPNIENCPCCGGVAKLRVIDDAEFNAYIMCTDCGMSSKLFDNLFDLCATWNRRA